MKEKQEYFHELILRMQTEFRRQDRSGIYGYTQRELGYNSNRIEGSRLSPQQTASIFETGTVSGGEVIRTKDVEEMTGHFRMFNRMLETYDQPLSAELVKEYHYCLKAGVFEDATNGYPCGDYKNRPNMIGGVLTAMPSEVPGLMNDLFSWYEGLDAVSLRELADFHLRYERIHPFQDGNGRTGRILLYKECLRRQVIPFVIEDQSKAEYYNALQKQDIDLLADYFRKMQETYRKMSELLLFGEEA